MGRDVDESEAVLDLALWFDRAQDLPVCTPGRSCVNVLPAEAGVITLPLALSPSSGAIAAWCWAALGGSLLLIWLRLRLQWRGLPVRPWMVLLSVALLLVGVVTSWAIGGWLDEVAAVYAGADGLPDAPTTSLLTAQANRPMRRPRGGSARCARTLADPEHGRSSQASGRSISRSRMSPDASTACS